MVVYDLKLPKKKIEERRERWEALSNFEYIDRVPFILPLAGFHHDWAYHPFIFDKEKKLELELAYIKRHLQLDDDYIPALWPEFDMYVVPSLIGGLEMEWTPPKMWPHLKEPRIKDITKDVYEIDIPDVKEAGLMPKVAEDIRFFAKETKGELPINVWDPQSPLNSAVLLYGIRDTARFIYDIYDHPKEVHMFLDILTDAFIEATQITYDIIEDCGGVLTVEWGELETPKASLCADFGGFFSPQVYREFGVPYEARIMRKLHGGFFHCCGPILWNLDNQLDRIPWILMYNFDLDINREQWREIAEKMRGRCMIQGLTIGVPAPLTPEIVYEWAKPSFDIFAPCQGFSLMMDHRAGHHALAPRKQTSMKAKAYQTYEWNASLEEARIISKGLKPLLEAYL